jgi:hypothetical protein
MIINKLGTETREPIAHTIGSAPGSLERSLNNEKKTQDLNSTVKFGYRLNKLSSIKIYRGAITVEATTPNKPEIQVTTPNNNGILVGLEKKEICI